MTKVRRFSLIPGLWR